MLDIFTAQSTSGNDVMWYKKMFSPINQICILYSVIQLYTPGTLESPAKHAKVQAIASLMSIILDPRGPYNLPVMVDSLNLNSFSSQTPPYVSKLLIAKGFVLNHQDILFDFHFRCCDANLFY